MSRSLMLLGGVLFTALVVSGCKTKADLRRESQLKDLQYKITEDRAKLDEDTQALKVELTRMNGVIEKLFDQNKLLRDRNRDLTEQVAVLEEDIEKIKVALQPKPAKKAAAKPANLKQAIALFESGKYEASAKAFERVLASKKASAKEKADAQYLLAESHYALKNFRSAAVEFARFRKAYAKDSRLPRAIYRQANCFRQLKKSREARLFYAELVDLYPKHSLANKAKKESSLLSKK